MKIPNFVQATLQKKNVWVGGRKFQKTNMLNQLPLGIININDATAIFLITKSAKSRYASLNSPLFHFDR